MASFFIFKIGIWTTSKREKLMGLAESLDVF